MGVSTITVRPKLNLLDARRIDETVYIGNRSDLARDQIINLHPAILTEKGSARLSMISIGDQNGQRVSKWTEKYNSIVGQSQKWVKLNGIVSANALRPLLMLSDWSKYFNAYDDAGTFGYNFGQINDSGEGSKIVTVGTGTQTTNILLNVENEDSLAYGGFALYPSVGRHIYVSPSGDIYVCVSIQYGAYTDTRAVLGKSSDGGKSWTWYGLDPSYSGWQDHINFTADNNGNLHIVWREYDTGDVNHRGIRYIKLNTSNMSFSAILTLSEIAGRYNLSPLAQVRPDGLSVEVMWAGEGYGTNPNRPNILSKVINANGTLGALQVITTNGADAGFPYYTTFGYDTNGYRHVTSIYKNVASTIYNLFYIYETGAGWQAIQQVNTGVGEPDTMHYSSNILNDKHNNVYIAYDIGPFDSTSKNPLYIRKIVGGAIGARTLIQAGNPDIGGTIPQIQVDKYGNIIVVHMSNTAPDSYNLIMLSPSFVILLKQRLFTAGAGVELSYIQIPWSIPPDLFGVNPNVPQQDLMFIMADYLTATPQYANIRIMYKGNSVLGAHVYNPQLDKYTYNVRGAINRTKFNSGFNPSV